MSDGRNESSMEEILSSIKRIIAEDRSMPLKKPSAARSADDEAVLELTEALKQETAVESHEDAAAEADRLIDDRKLAAMRESLTALATMERVDRQQPEGAAPAQGKTVEALVAEMLRPMLKEWLDENLPALVEEMVAKEIRRISLK